MQKKIEISCFRIGKISNLFNKIILRVVLSGSFMLSLGLSYKTLSQGQVAKGGYGDMLYPYVHEYDQMLAYKIGVDYCPKSQVAYLNATQVLDVIRRVDNLTLGIPKIVYLVGWQSRGLDTGYPSFAEVNGHIKRQEDSTALESLRWLMREGPKYHTLVSLHVNFSDCYLDDNPLGPQYKDRDIIVRNVDGTYREGYIWCDHLAYRASNFRNWYQETFKKNQIDPLFAMIPELKLSGSLHPDAWYDTDDPYYGISEEQDCEAMREMTIYTRRKYNVDLTTEFDRRRPKGVDFVLFHPMLWHYGWDEQTPPDPMKIPSYFQTGGDAETWSSESPTIQTKFFGESCTLEGEINLDPIKIPGALKAFATHTLPWYFLNRQLRNTFDGNTAVYSGGITASYPGKTVIRIGNDLLQDGNDVLIPALWRSSPVIMAYSSDGYTKRSWKLPEEWKAVSKADVYDIIPGGLKLKQKNLKISSERMVSLSLNADEGVSIVPAGNDPNKDVVMPTSGEIEFRGVDESTKGSWQKKYGAEGNIIIGSKQNIPAYLQGKYINGADNVWLLKTRDIQALQNPSGTDRIAAHRSAGMHEIIDLNFTDNKEHDVALYCLDWDRQGRWLVVDAIDANSRKLLDSRNLTDFAGGKYLKYRVKGRVQFRLTNVWTERYTLSPDAGFSGIFFDLPEKIDN